MYNINKVFLLFCSHLINYVNVASDKINLSIDVTVTGKTSDIKNQQSKTNFVFIVIVVAVGTMSKNNTDDDFNKMLASSCHLVFVPF